MAWLPGWSYRKKLTVDHSKVDSDCSDFPVKVILGGDNFDFAKARPDGYDIRFTASDGETLLKHEREIHTVVDWGKFNGTVTSPDTYDDSNSGYLQFHFRAPGYTHKYAALDNSIDASSDFAFSFKMRVTASVTTNAYGSAGVIGLSDNTTAAYNHYVGAMVVYDANSSNSKTYISSIFEGSQPNQSTGFAYSDGIALDADTDYIIKLSKTGTTLKVAVCNSSDEELWSDTATASTTPTVAYFKAYNYILANPTTDYTTFRLSDFYNGSTEETFQLYAAVYHVKVPTASSTSDTDIYMYYGKADASDGADAENVWDSNYKVVHHMTPDLYDSTANNHDGSNQGSESAINRAGHYRTFNDAYVSLGSSVNFSLTDKITIEGHCKSTSDTNMRLFNRHEAPSGNYGYLLARSLTNDNAAWRISKTNSDWNGGVSTTNSWPINTDLNVAGVYDGSNMRIYLDGSEDTSGDFPVSLSGNIASVSHNAYIGAGNAATNKWYGNIYEFRLSNIARSAAWIKATHASLADTLLTYGSEEAVPRTPRVMVVWA